MTSDAGAEGASPETETGEWANVMRAERAVRCPSDAAAVPPAENVGAVGATYEATKSRSVEKGRAIT